MGIDLPKILAVLPMGVIRRTSSKTALILLNDDSNQSHQINLDEHNEYTFSSEAFCFNKPSQRAFFDRTQKVLEYAYDGQNLSIQIFTTHQTNLFIDVNVDECDIRAVGPLCIQGNFSILHRYNVDAKALIQEGTLACKDKVFLNVTEGLSTFGEFNTPNLIIRAGFYHQSAKMTVEQFFDMAAQVFCQTEEAVFKASSLRMIAEISRISGQLEISEHCFSAISHWILGEEDAQSTIHFPASHHVHVGTLSIKDNTNVVIGEQNSPGQNSQWVVDDDIEIDATSSLVVYHGYLLCHKMECAGVAGIYNSSLSIETLIDRGRIAFLRSQLDVKSIHIETALFSVQHSNIVARKIHAMASEVLIQDGSALNISDKFLTDKATVKITDSDLSVKQKVVLQGCSKIRASIIQTDYLSISDKVSIKKSHILAKVLQLQDTVCVEQSNFKAKDVSLSGQLDLDNVQIDTNSIEYQSSDARLRRNFVKAKRIVIEGGIRPEQFLFESSRLMAKSFTMLEEVGIQDSTMIGVDDAKANHSIHGHLFLRNSRWITHSRVRSLVGSHIHPCDYSEIIAGKITASGDISVDESLVQCEGLSLIGSNTTLQRGEVVSDNAVYIHSSELAAHTNSSVVAENMHLSGYSHVRLKKSHLHLSSQLTASHDSELDSTQTKIAAGKVRFLGRTALVKSLLSAEELIIYDDFSIQQSIVHAKEDIVLAATAKAKTSDSTLHARNIESFASVSLESTQLHARETAALWTGSKTSMTGASVVKANDVVLRGKLVTQKQEPSKQSLVKPSIITDNHLHMSPAGTISGDEDLMLFADTISQSGDIDLLANFTAKGRHIDNIGILKAKSIDLRFDDAVVNHGSISTKNLIIHSNLMNIFGRIYAEQSMSSSGFVSFNSGVIAANNHMNDSLVSMNLGLIAPHLLADPRFIFSWNNLIGTARNLALMLSPVHTSGIQLAFMLPGFLMSSAKLYQSTKGFARIFDLKRHEYMPILCQIKSLMLLGQGMYSGGNSFYNEEYVNWQTSLSQMYNNPNKYGQDWSNTFQYTNWQEFSISSAETFAGSYTDTSLFHANLGVSLGANTLKTNWMHVNIGQESSLFSHNIATNVLYNCGRSMGSKSSFVATHIRNKGTLSGAQAFYLRSKTVDNGKNGHINGMHASIDIERLEQRGEFIAEAGRVHIGAFQDSDDASTLLKHVVLDGSTLDSSGHLDLSHSHVHEKERFITSTTSQFLADNVDIKTGTFHAKGQLDYQHHLFIQADTAILAKGSVLNGQKTADEQLFTQPTENDPEAKPLLNPQHVLIIEAPKVALDGELRGGDYTDVHGKIDLVGKEIGRCEEVKIGDSANIDLKHGRIATRSLLHQGTASLDGFGIDAVTTDIAKESSFTLNHSVLKGQILQEEGNIQLHDSQIQVNSIVITDNAHPELIDSFLIGQTVKDASHLSFGGDSGVITDDYQHQGSYAQLTQGGKKSTFSVKAKTARLQGTGDLENAVFQIDHFADSAQFIAGTGSYLNYHIRQSLGWRTLDDLTLNDPISRDCDIAVQAASIQNQFDYNKAYQLFFTSTVGDIAFSKMVQGSNVYAYSARDILNGGQVFGAGKVFFQAGRNVENRGKIASGKYTQILAKGNVVNVCQEEVYQGQWDTRRNYRAAVISGGTGEDTNGIGLHIEADGEVISDASDFVSQGSNYIRGRKGVHFNERHHVYNAFREKHKIHQSNFLKKCKNLVAKQYVYSYGTATDIGVSHILSTNGRNIIVSNEGEVSSVASQFVSPNGNDIHAKGDVRLYGLKINNYVHQTHKDWWGLKTDQITQFYDTAQPTLFVDNGTTRVHSAEGSVDARGAYFIGDGDLEIKAKKRIFLGADILDRDITESVRSFGWSIPGVGAWNSYNQGGSVWSIGSALDPSLGKVNALFRSQSKAEYLANATNLGIDLANTGNDFMRGIRGGKITDELLTRYGLGHDGYLAPSVKLSLSQKKTKTRFQTQAQGGIDRGGNVRLQAGEGVELENGVGVYAGKNLDINAPYIKAHAGKLLSTMRQTTRTESLGIMGLEGVQSVGMAVDRTQTSSTNYINAVLSARGNMHLHHNGGAVQTLELDGANIYAQTLDANIEKLIIGDKQDICQTQTNTLSLATSGQFGFYQGRGRNVVTQNHSGIHVVEGINTGGHKVVVNETHMIGGKITTEGENHFKTDKLIAETLTDIQQYIGWGINGNIHDINRLLNDKPSNKAGEQIFSMVSLQMDSRDFSATQMPVIHGAQGTDLSLQTLEGQLEMRHDSGMVIQKDDSLHVTIDIPVTNRAFLAQASHNFQDAKATLSPLFHPKSKSQEPMAFGKPEPIAPVEDDDVNTRLSLQRHKRRKENDLLEAEELEAALETSGLLFSENDNKIMQLTVTQAQHEYKITGKLSDNTKHALKKQITAATTQIVKAYGSAVFDEMAKAAALRDSGSASFSSVSAKDQAKSGHHFRKLGLLWKLWMNEELALLDDKVRKEDKFKYGIATTVVESGIDFVLEFGLKDMAGPIGIALMLLDISDKYYDEGMVKKRLKTGESHLTEIRTLYNANDIIAGWALERAALDQIASARRMQAGHDISGLSEKAAKKIVSFWDTTGQIEFSKPKKFLKCFFSQPDEAKNDKKPSSPNISFG